MKNTILATIAFIAFAFALGSVGAYANDTIGFGQLLLQVGISVLVARFAVKPLCD